MAQSAESLRSFECAFSFAFCFVTAFCRRVPAFAVVLSLECGEFTSLCLDAGKNSRFRVPLTERREKEPPSRWK